VNAQDPAVLAEGGLDIVDLVPFLGGGNEILSPIFDPFDRPVKLDGQPGDKHLFRVKHQDLGSEPAADEGGDDPNPIFR